MLARAGVRDADLKDASQEVFIIVATKLSEHDPSVKLTSWLYGIAVRVAANHRRKVQRKREDLTGDAIEPTDHETASPEDAIVREQARLELAELLDGLPPEQRIVFEMFELEEMACPAIAEALGIPLGTAYTRLRAARMALSAKAAEARA